MSQSDYLTVGQSAAIFGVPAWKIRRVVAALELKIQRAGQYRLIPRDQLGIIAAELQRQGWLANRPATETRAVKP